MLKLAGPLLVIAWPVLLLTYGYDNVVSINEGNAQRLDRIEQSKEQFEIPLGEGKSLYFRNPDKRQPPSEFPFPIYRYYEGSFETNFDVDGRRVISRGQLQEIVQGLLRKNGESAWRVDIVPVRTYYQKGIFTLKHPAALQAEIYLEKPQRYPFPNRTQCVIVRDGQFAMGRVVSEVVSRSKAEEYLP